MRFEATVKKLNQVKSGQSEHTGNMWRYQGIILEANDGDKVARWLATLGTKMVEEVERQGIKEGDEVIVDLRFTTLSNYNKFVENRIYVENLSKFLL